MSNDIIDPRQGQLNDPYAALGAKLNKPGVFLNFSKGEYVYGQDKEELPLGKLVVVNVPGIQLGWKRWSGGKPVEERMELARDMRPVERREDLGDTDQAMWERDSQSNPRDPWVMTYTIEMANPDAEEVYSFSTSSEGGKRAIGKLLTEYSREVRMRPNMLPIVKLERDSYMHNNKEFGKVYNPILTIVGWTDENSPSISERTAHYNEEPIPVGQHTRHEPISREPGEEDDDIPFDVLESPVARRVPVREPVGRPRAPHGGGGGTRF